MILVYRIIGAKIKNEQTNEQCSSESKREKIPYVVLEQIDN